MNKFGPVIGEFGISQINYDITSQADFICEWVDGFYA
jgi:hypothetical protein